MCAKAGTPLTGLDVSCDASLLQAATMTDELQFYSVVDGARVAVPATCRDTDWATVTVPFGWRVQGCWKPTPDSEEDAAAACERAPRFMRHEYRPQATYPPGVSTVDRSRDTSLLAKGCFDGTIAVYNYPTQAPGMAMRRLPGHGSRIAKVRFTSDMRHLIALGQFNRTITVYALVPEEDDLFSTNTPPPPLRR